MKIKIVVHEAEEGGFWAEVPAIPGCATQGDSMDELMRNLQEAIERLKLIDTKIAGDQKTFKESLSQKTALAALGHDDLAKQTDAEVARLSVITEKMAPVLAEIQS